MLGFGLGGGKGNNKKEGISQKVLDELRNIKLSVEHEVPGGVYLYNLLSHYRFERYAARMLINDRAATELLQKAIMEDWDGGELVDAIRRSSRIANIIIYRFAQGYFIIFKYILEDDKASEWIVDQMESILGYLDVWFDGKSSFIKLLRSELGLEWIKANILPLFYRLYILAMEK